MKGKSTVPEKGKRLESLKVELSEQPVSQANEGASDIDMREFHQLFRVNDILEKLCGTDLSVIDCEDASSSAYRDACALLSYIEYAEKGLQADMNIMVEPVAGAIVNAIQLQLEILRLASKRLVSLREAKGQVEAKTSETA